MSEPDLELELRYRRLLAFYPWSHRRVYEEEMLAVLIAGAPPGKSRPTVTEAAHLVGSGLVARARAAATGFTRPGWADAAAVVGLLGALVLLSQRGVRLFDSMAGRPSDLPVYLRAAGWLAVVLAALVGLRRSAAVLAWATTLGEAFLFARQYGSDPVSAVHILWPLALGATAAAALTVPAAPRQAFSALGLPRLLAFVAGLGLVQAVLVINAQHRAVIGNGAGAQFYTFYGLEAQSEPLLFLWIAAVAVGALSAVLAALTLPGRIRLRIAVLLLPTVTLIAMVKLTLDGWSYSNDHMGHPIYLVPLQWALLVAVPLAVLALGVLLVQLSEQITRLTALGRTADRERLDPT